LAGELDAEEADLGPAPACRPSSAGKEAGTWIAYPGLMVLKVYTCTLHRDTEEGERMAVLEKEAPDHRTGISLEILVDRLGRDAGEEFFGRVDDALREGLVIHGTNVRESRMVFSKARTQGHAQLVVPGRSGTRSGGAADISESLVIITMDDFEAVVKAGRDKFDWVELFSASAGLPQARSRPQLVRGSRGRRDLRY
jgi:hypothetical protein